MVMNLLLHADGFWNSVEKNNMFKLLIYLDI